MVKTSVSMDPSKRKKTPDLVTINGPGILVCNLQVSFSENRSKIIPKIHIQNFESLRFYSRLAHVAGGLP